MPRYFFHVHDGRDIPDEEGVELPGPEEARNQAVVACGEALKDLDGEFWESEEWTMTVKDWQATSCANSSSSDAASAPLSSSRPCSVVLRPCRRQPLHGLGKAFLGGVAFEHARPA